MNEEHIKSMVERGIQGEDDGFTIIPDAVLEDGSLSPTEILLFCRISKMGKCWASNAWFASKMNKSETWVSKSINSLIKKGYVEHVGFTGRFRVIRAIKDLNYTSRVEQEFNGGLNNSSRQGRTRVQPESTDKNKEENTGIAKAIGEPENPDLENPIQENPYTGKSLNIVRKTKKERLKKEILKNTAKAGSREDIVSKAYYEAIKSLSLPVTNHTVIRAKIKEMKSLYSEEQCIWYLNFMKNDYASWQTKYKPQVTQALDIYSKSNAIIKRLVEDNKKAEVF